MRSVLRHRHRRHVWRTVCEYAPGVITLLGAIAIGAMLALGV